MGCDIHCYAEVRKNGKWELVKDKIFPNAYHSKEMLQNIQQRLRTLKAIKNPTPDELEQIEYLEKDDFYGELCQIPYRGRNYHLFSILADVRNYDDIVPIDDPRGLPHDLSPEVSASADKWDSDGHSHSWFTVKEILDFDWERICTIKAIMSAKYYDEWIELYKKDGTSPESYCRGAGGKNTEVLSAGDYVKYKRANQLDPDKRYYVRAEWKQSYRSTSTYFLEKTLPALQSLGNPEDVRFVFWFDN